MGSKQHLIVALLVPALSWAFNVQSAGSQSTGSKITTAQQAGTEIKETQIAVSTATPNAQQFRQTASLNMQLADEAFGAARANQGQKRRTYQQIAYRYEELAVIKRRAARLADLKRWQEINWDRYRQIQQEISHLQSSLGP